MSINVMYRAYMNSSLLALAVSLNSVASVGIGFLFVILSVTKWLKYYSVFVHFLKRLLFVTKTWSYKNTKSADDELALFFHILFRSCTLSSLSHLPPFCFIPGYKLSCYTNPFQLRLFPIHRTDLTDFMNFRIYFAHKLFCFNFYYVADMFSAQLTKLIV